MNYLKEYLNILPKNKSTINQKVNDMKKAILFIVLAMVCNSLIMAQGKVFKTKNAEAAWGKPDQSIQIPTSELKEWIQSEEFVMFKVADKKVNILGKDRKALKSQYDVQSDDVYFVYSSDVISELIELGASDTTYVETRNGVTTVTIGVYTMEMSFPCPPCCPDCDEG